MKEFWLSSETCNKSPPHPEKKQPGFSQTQRQTPTPPLQQTIKLQSDGGPYQASPKATECRPG